jgi:MFS family permease
VAGHRRVRILLLLFGVVGIFGWSYAVLLPAYATDILHVGESRYGVLLSANGFGALLGALTVATYGSRVRPRRMILGGLWLFSAMLALLAMVRWYPLVLLCLGIGGWGMILYFSTTNTLIQSSVSNAMRGRVMGIWALVFGGMMPLGGHRIWISVPCGGRAVDHRGGGNHLCRSRVGHMVGGAPQSSDRC